MIHASVIVPARDAAHTLPRTLDALRDQETDFAYEVLVVDDGSRDATADLVRAAGEPVRLVGPLERGKGAALARNAGVRESKGALLAFCDSDCFPVRGWLAAGVRALEHAELVQGKALPEPGVPIGPFDRSLWVTREAGLWETANLFTTRAIFDRVGGFEDTVITAGKRPMGEDVWFGWRAKRSGARSAFCSQALVHHAVFGQGAREYVAERSRRRHFPELVSLMPELREAFLFRGVFLDSRTAALDGALAAVLLVALSRKSRYLLGTLPYAHLAWPRAREHGWIAPTVDLAADLLGAWALARGTLTTGTPVL